MTDAPFCNVSVAELPGEPQSPTGFQRIPAKATLDQIANIINNNFALLMKGNYLEDKTKRVTKVVRISDPANSGAYVDVEQIVAITLVNSQTGQKAVWKR